MTTETRALPTPPWHEQPGLLRRMFRDPQPVLDEMADRYESMCALGAGPVRMAIVGDPAALRELFALPNESFRWGHKFNVLEFVVGPGSMIVSDGPDHRRRRWLGPGRLQPSPPQSLDPDDRRARRRGDRRARRARTTTKPRPSTCTRSVARIVLEIVVRAFFGDRMAERVDEIGELFQRPQRYLEGSMLQQLPHRIPYTNRARVRADRRALDALIDEQIAAATRRTRPATPSTCSKPWRPTATLSDAEIRDQVVTLIGAGYDTTSATLSWMIWCATLTPGLWERLRAEADDGLRGSTGAAPADESTLARLELANRVMRETTRLAPRRRHRTA